MRRDIHGVRIKLKPGCMGLAREWAETINARSGEALESLALEGITLEAAFLDRVGGDDYLVYVMRGDFEGAKKVAEASDLAIDAFHREFKKECWESVTGMVPLVWLESV